MDAPRTSVIPFGPIISFTIAVVSLGVTSVITYHRTEPQQPQSRIHVFDPHTKAGLGDIIPLTFNEDSKTNRTIWETVSTKELHAGIQRIEPEAWIPSHSHDTEELVTVISGFGIVIDENGLQTELRQGSMVHIEKRSQHAIRNIAIDKPLLIMWSFPTRFGYNKFQFRQRYNTR